jgi:SAM-dependent methyltransferase
MRASDNSIANARSRSYAPAVLYQHPLAYLLGLEGVALLRAFAGEHDREFVGARFDAIRRLLDQAEAFGDGMDIPAITTTEGYERWAPTYDEPGNGLLPIEQPVVREILDGIPPGVAVDAACGTGRHTEYLVELGHRVIAVDGSPSMLEIAKAKVPAAEYHEADLHELPVPDDSVDVVVCALALAHVSDLMTAMREFARVLRPGGHLVISEAHGLAAGIRPPIVMRDSAPEAGYLPHTNRLPGDYLRAALQLGFEVRRCEEPGASDGRAESPGRSPEAGEALPLEDVLPEGPPNIWLLHYWDPAATSAAFLHQPAALIWSFQLAGGSAD